jgi:hypothetical protein
VALACSRSEPEFTEARPEFAATCLTKPTITPPNLITVTAGTTNQAAFAVKSNCTVTSYWDLWTVPTGQVTSATITSAGSGTPGTWNPGETKTIVVTYTAGSAGQGTVVLNASNDGPPLTQTSAIAKINVVAGTGIPYGPWGLDVDTLPSGSIWTGSGLGNNLGPNFVLRLLETASSKSVGMWLSFVGADEDFLNADKTFNLTRWKTAFDDNTGGQNPDGTSTFYQRYLPYIPGTYQGTILLDDIAIFNKGAGPTFAQIEAMAAHSKLRFPALPTVVRATPAKLDTISGGAQYAKLDAGWAQYRSDRGPPDQYSATHIATAKRLKLGLVMGINIKKGLVRGFQDLEEVPPAMILDWGQQLFEADTSGYICGFLMWDDGYSRLENSVFNTLANLAKNHVKAPCKRRP